MHSNHPAEGAVRIGGRCSRLPVVLSSLVVVSLVLGMADGSVEIASVAFVIIPYLIVLMYVRDKPAVLGGIIVACVTVYQAAACLNSYFIDLPGVRPDSQNFVLYAAKIANSGEIRLSVEYEFYVNMVAVMFRSFGWSYYLASLFSVTALAVSLLVLARILKELDVDAYAGLTLLICGLVPALVIIGSAPMREAFQLLLLQTTLWLSLLMIKSKRPAYFVLTIIFVFVFGILHKGMLLVAVIYTSFISMVWVRNSMSSTSSRQIWYAGSAFSVLIAAVVCVVYFNESGRALIGGLLEKDPMTTISRYRYAVDNLGKPNTAYGFAFRHHSVWSGAVSVFKVYTYYLFYPVLIKDVLSLQEIYAAVESWMRLILLGFIAYRARLIFGKLDQRHVLLLFTFLTVTFVWSLGTTNYGQAIRHHILSNWIILVLAASCMSIPVNKGGRDVAVGTVGS